MYIRITCNYARFNKIKYFSHTNLQNFFNPDPSTSCKISAKSDNIKSVSALLIMTGSKYVFNLLNPFCSKGVYILKFYISTI